MTLSLVASLVILQAGAPSETKALFLGNSHTTVNNVPGMVRQLMASVGKRMQFELRTGAFLEDIAQNPEVQRIVHSGQFDVVIMQAAKVSSSHKYVYSQASAIALAKAARKARTRVVYFAEWPRESVDETEYILDVYRGIAREGGGTIAPVGYAWKRFQRGSPRTRLWSDGNHANPKGSLLAAHILFRWIVQDAKVRPKLRIDSVTADEAALMERIARELYVERSKGKVD